MRAHTDEKPYICGSCHRCFPRKDIFGLIQHMSSCDESLMTPTDTREILTNSDTREDSFSARTIDDFGDVIKSEEPKDNEVI